VTRDVGELLYRALLVVRFVAFMAGCYLLLHMAAARVFAPDGKIVGFFRIVTAPLTTPIRALWPALPEPAARHVALGILAGVWLLAAWLLTVVGRQLG
jgi:hypothetical protein